MTVLEAIKANKNLSGFSDPDILLACALRNVNEREPVTSASEQGIDLVSADLLLELITQPDFTEGKLSIKYPREEIKKTILRVARKYNDSKLLGAIKPPSVTDKTDLW